MQHALIITDLRFWMFNCNSLNSKYKLKRRDSIMTLSRFSDLVIDYATCGTLSWLVAPLSRLSAAIGTTQRARRTLTQ